MHYMLRAPWKLLSAISGTVILACGTQADTLPDGLIQLGENVELRRLADGVWVHTTWRELSGGRRIPSNGLVVADGDSLLLIDAAWGDPETERLIEGAERELGRPIRLLLATHHHDDRISGVQHLRERRLQVVAHPLTAGLARDAGRRIELLEDLGSPGSLTQVGPLEVYYPGPGHAVDNVVVWLSGAGVLFAGCLVRPSESPSLGNTEDADLAHWPMAIEALQQRYGHASVVVPGHGPPTAVTALDHTLRLLSVETPSR